MLDNELIAINEIARRIEQKIQENPNLIVSVKTDRETEYDVFVHVLDELKVANATRISIAEPTI